MYHFEYVTKAEARPVWEEINEILREVQNQVREQFTFQFRFVGSFSRNMITCDRKSNIGFDFDVNIYVNDEEECFSAEDLRRILKRAIDRVARRYGYKDCEDSTRVLTMKMVDRSRRAIRHSCDFAIVWDSEDGQQYVRYNKKANYYSWEYQGGAFQNLEERMKWLKENGYWGELRDYYLEKKNTNQDPNKKSRSIFAEAVKEMCDKAGYFD